MANSGTLVNEFLDEFPKVTRPGAGGTRQRTDVDVALEQLVKEYEATGAPSRVLKVIDYKKDADGNEVDAKTAATRAQARVQANRKRGYTKDAGWQLAAVNGELIAKFWGPGGHPKPETNGNA
jgi:hypothetical protein